MIMKKTIVFATQIGFAILNLFLIPILFIAAFISRLFPKTIDVGIGPIPMINNVIFKKALERKGFKVETFANSTYYITQEFDFIYTRDVNRIYYYLPTMLYIRSIFRYKCVYIYFNGCILGGKRFLDSIEPIILRMANVKVVVMPYGSDSQYFDNAKNKLMQHCLCLDYPAFFKNNQKKIRRNIERWTRWADIVLAHQDCIDYLPYWDKVRWSIFGTDTTKVYSEQKSNNGSAIRIFHAPNHRSIKGSNAVEKAVSVLKDEGYDIEYVYAHGISNTEVIKLIQTCDIIIDQLVMGAYSMFSIEAMACGKPVICYIRPDLKEFYEAVGAVERDELPLISATVLTIEDVLRKLLNNKSSWAELGKRSREYAVKYHSLDAVGSFFESINHELGVFAQSQVTD